MRTESKPTFLPAGGHALTALRRPAALIALHWATALIGATTVALVLAHELADGKVLRAWLLNGHRAFGALVLALTLARLIIRLRHHPLPESVAATTVHGIAIGSVHLALYGLLVAVPLLGWALTNAHGQPVSLFGLYSLPSLIERDADLADTLADVHEEAAWILVAAVALHVAAALWHHFIRRDPVLLAMLPARGVSPVPVPTSATALVSIASKSTKA